MNPAFDARMVAFLLRQWTGRTNRERLTQKSADERIEQMVACCDESAIAFGQ
jgi:hypothetical protein